MTRSELRERTMRFAVRAVLFCRTLPQTWEARQVAGQLIDSSTSTAINYRAAGRSRSTREFIAKIGTVLEEADESAGWLDLIRRLDLSTTSELRWLANESEQLVAIFTASLKTAKENQVHERERQRTARCT